MLVNFGLKILKRIRLQGVFKNEIKKWHKKGLTFVRPFYFAREERLELPTPGFGDQCSTN